VHLDEEKEQTIAILMIGDSLTKGFYNHGHSHHPYSLHLSELVTSYYSTTKGITLEFETSAVSGQTLAQIMKDLVVMYKTPLTLFCKILMKWFSSFPD
jgi:hypothetical protein